MSSPTCVFLSYRMHSGDAVRQLGTWLEMSDIPIWFAEWGIAIESQDDDFEIDDCIKRGIAACSHAILVTEPTYAGSKWCIQEAQEILQRIPSDNIVRIRAGDDAPLRDVLPETEKIATLDIGNLQQLDFRSIEQFLKSRNWELPWKMCKVITLGQRPHHFKIPYTDTTLDIGGWQESGRRSEAAGSRGMNVERVHTTFVRQFDKPVELTVTSARYSTPAAIAAGLAAHSGIGFDERTAREHTVEFAKEYTTRVLTTPGQTAKVVGVHHITARGRAAFGMTYSTDPNSNHVPQPETDEWCCAMKFIVIVAPMYRALATDRDEGYVEMIFTFVTQGRDSGIRRLKRLSPHFLSIIGSMDGEKTDQSKFVFGPKPTTRLELGLKMAMIPFGCIVGILLLVLLRGMSVDLERQGQQRHEVESPAVRAYTTGNKALIQKNYDQAIQSFDEAIRLGFNEAEVYNNRGIAYEEMGDPNRALEDFDRAIERDPRFVKALINRSVNLRQRERYDVALVDCDAAIRLLAGSNLNSDTSAREDLALAYNARGNIQRFQGNTNQAIDDYTDAITTNPAFGLAYRNRAEMYYRQDRFRRALADFSEAIAIHSDDVRAIYNRGVTYLQMADAPNAIKDFSEAIRLDPQDPDPYAQRAKAYALVGDRKHAQQDWQKSSELERSPKN